MTVMKETTLIYIWKNTKQSRNQQYLRCDNLFTLFLSLSIKISNTIVTRKEIHGIHGPPL